MASLIIIHFGLGDISSGFPHINVELLNSKTDFRGRIHGSLPSNPQLLQSLQEWQHTYLELKNNHLLRIKVIEPPRQISTQPFKPLSEQLSEEFNQWLMTKEFTKIEKYLRTHLSPQDEICVFLGTQQESLLHLPWHLWDFIDAYPKAEIIFSNPEYTHYPSPPTGGKIRILAVLGNGKNININTDVQLLKSLADVDIQWLIEPTISQLNEALWDELGWDIFFFAGHSRTEGKKGIMELSEGTSITVKELRDSLTRAGSKGLQLAIFNSCDGLGIAQQIAHLQIPQIIVMREPVPDTVAHHFLKYFLIAFAGGINLPLAVKQARQQLQPLEPLYLCASWLPILYQNSGASSKNWQQLGRYILDEKRCPYMGLSPFTEENARFFRGRDELIQLLYDTLEVKPLVAVIGASGSGKSSLVSAGLLPRLRSTNWHIITFRPGANPSSHLNRLIASLPPTPVLDNYLIFVDQWEEIYTLCHDELERKAFIDALLEIKCKLVLTLRVDFLQSALSYSPLADALQQADLKVGSLNEKELRDTISIPARLVGLDLEEGLTERILNDIGDGVGNLCLLEFILYELWERREDRKLTHQAYNKIGGIKAISSYAQRVYDALSKEEKVIARKIFLCLITIDSNSRYARRQEEKSALLKGSNPELSEVVLRRLVETKLLVVNEDNNCLIVVDLVHESLVNYWDNLKGWIEENEELVKRRDKLQQDALHWQQIGESKQPEDLLSGTNLTKSYQLIKEHSHDLYISNLARHFVMVSWHHQRWKNIIKIMGLSSAVLGVFTTVILTLLYSYTHYYYKTLRSVQTIDFNILSHTLPYKLSSLMVKEEHEEIQEVIYSNHAQFAIVVTDCRSDRPNCQEEQIIYINRNEKELRDEDLSQHPYDILRNPPPIYAEQDYPHHWYLQRYPTGRLNQGEIIGRVYYIRRKPNSFTGHFWEWINTGLFR